MSEQKQNRVGCNRVAGERAATTDLHDVSGIVGDGARATTVQAKHAVAAAQAAFEGRHIAVTCASDEILGPVAAVTAVSDDDEALAIVNDTQFNLSAGTAGSSLKRATLFKRAAAAGRGLFSTPAAGSDCHLPLGGGKVSRRGGREPGRTAGEVFTKVKTAYSRA